MIWSIEIVEEDGIYDLLDRDSPDVIGGQKREGDALHSRRDRLRDIHGHH